MDGSGPATVIGTFRAAMVPILTKVFPNAAPTAGGVVVTITGSGFSPGATVVLGGTPATNVVVVNSTTLRMTVPAHAGGLVDVEVTNPGQQRGTLPGSFYYSPPPAGTRWYPLAPCRILDTRNATGPLGGPVLAAGETRVFDIVTNSTTCGIPSDAVSLTTNVTVDAPTQTGEMRVYPADAVWTGTSVLSFKAGATRANNAMLKLPEGGSGLVRVTNSSGGTAHCILDVNGYFK